MKRSNLAEPKAAKRDRSPSGHKLSVTINDLPSDKDSIHEPPVIAVDMIGQSGSQSDVMMDEVDGPDLSALRKAEMDKLHMKMQKTMERIKAEQREKEDNVNEYLRISSASSTDKQQTQRIKTAFEKRNQKSTQVIDQLQRKLETYKKRIHETQMLSTVANTRHRPSKNVFRDVGQGLKDVGANIKEGITGFSGSLVSKPKDLVSLVKNKFSSADNITALKDDTSSIEEPDKLSHPGSNTLPPGFKYGSDDEASSMTSGSLGPSGTRSTPPHAGISTTSQLVDVCPVDLGPTMAELHEVRETQSDQHQEIQSVKTQMQLEFNFMKQALDEERYRSERLEEQINDLTELHQHEVTNLRQEMSGIEEKMEYQLDERTRDLQEALETCQTRITKMELQLQQQRLISMEGIENSTFRALVTKLINVALAMLAVILVFVSTIANFATPFLTSRMRGITTFFFIVVMISLYRNRELVLHLVARFTDAHGLEIYQQPSTAASSTHQEELPERTPSNAYR